MRVKTTEKIIIDWKESELWDGFVRLVEEINNEITVDEIVELITELRKIMMDLEEYMEVE